MLGLEDDTMLIPFEAEEIRHPSLRKRMDDLRTIYQSREFRRPIPLSFVAIADCIQIWDLFQARHLFGDIFDERGNHDPFKHLALMVALIRPPPADFIKQSKTTEQCLDSNGTIISIVRQLAGCVTRANILIGTSITHEYASPPSTSLEDLEKRLSGNGQESFLIFLRSMLRWLPGERKTARQLLEDPWLQ